MQLGTRDVPDIILGIGNRAGNKIDKVLYRAYFLKGDIDNKFLLLSHHE